MYLTSCSLFWLAPFCYRLRAERCTLLYEIFVLFISHNDWLFVHWDKFHIKVLCSAALHVATDTKLAKRATSSISRRISSVLTYLKTFLLMTRKAFNAMTLKLTL